ncbi:heme A synthase [Roseobacter sp. HKCCA0434]|uniref:heme A synthase n=1 Tax=Roseobacter sp. HKCCA0434 TaxID=3079297 RepID=UPI002905D801|nr:heme A synthase [Roseobacter sp. HKCCA0434]
MAQRAIFEDVGSEAKREVAAPPQKPDAGAARRAISVWLGILFALVVVMIAVGGLTRLTDSGLSITEWAPLSGALPPMTEADWQAEFDAYRQIPEYQLQNRGMSLGEFKYIYWWEWGHRQLGRVIGLVWAAGFAWFAIRRQIPTGWTPRLLGLGLLGGLQGAIGWWMVSSGLEGTMLDVASHRLAVHLGLAFVILGLIAWFIFRLRRLEGELLQARRQRNTGLFRLDAVLVGLVFAQILMGALVAGIDAGRSFTDWPLMGGQVVPPAALELEPVTRNFTENGGLVQFNHRILAYIVTAFAILVFLRARRSSLKAVRSAHVAMIHAVALQVVLGIVTVLYAAPLGLAIAHQLVAVLLWVLALRARFVAGYPPAQSVRA